MIDLRGSSQPHLQTVWGWKIAAYLFGAGMGAGSYSVGATAILYPALAERRVALLCMWLGAIVVLLSVTFLVWDLGRPERFLRVLFKVRRSWLSRGSWILIAFVACAGLTLLLGTPPSLATVNLLFSLAVAAYTGLLLGTMLARSLWNNPLLPVLFLISALSTGVAWVGIGGLAVSAPVPGLSSGVIHTAMGLRSAHVILLASELATLYFYLSVAYGRSRDAVELLVKGRLSRSFWLGIVAVGIVLPLLVDLLARDTSFPWWLLADGGVLVGGYLLRRLILYAGVRTPVNLGRPLVIRSEV